jgi:uncharacterized membrane protein
VSNVWRYLKTSAGSPTEADTTIGNFQRLAKAWETRALAAESANRDLRRELTEQIRTNRELMMDLDEMKEGVSPS